MNYKRDLSHLNNVILGVRSPRYSGETENRSEWKEYKSEIVFDYKARVALIEKLAQENKEVFVKTATLGGHIRIFVKS